MPNQTQTDESQLRTLHQKVLDAHLKSNVELLLEDENDRYVVASRGTVAHPTKEERRQRLGPYLQATTFEEYRDEITPVVQVSPDGKLGWVIVQVYARGTQKAQNGSTLPIEFVSAWIELYEKQANRWFRTGNVSNFKP
ncbi:hypothetical protein [Candidatus Leptofilum sp.]|uniref:hypothetical protein n=1 Tax=Candidatus Leptofilum sp. TaxID=3241576 RepID=UPI003B5BF3D3